MIDRESEESTRLLKLALEARARMRELEKALEESNERIAKGLPVGVTVEE